MGFKQWHILIVENQAEMTFCISDVLAYFDIPFLCVSMLEEAIDLLETGDFTHVIVDLGLRNTDPWQVLQRLQDYAHERDLPRIAVTDYHEIGLAEAAIEAGFMGYFIKPVDDFVLLCALQNILEN